MFDEPKIMFWPVGTGDSTSVVIDGDVVMQVDIRDLRAAGEGDDDHAALIDTLAEHLPKVDGRPYLAGFVLTHPDEDHVLGFAELLRHVDIGEIWFTPRVFMESDKDLCDDAVAFKKEADRRVRATIDANGDPGSGERVHLIGYSALLEASEFVGFPEDRLTVPGNVITNLDGREYSGKFSAFVHAPFADEAEGDRNNTSLCMQVVLGNDPTAGGVLLFGDIAYPRIRRIFDETSQAGNEKYLSWKVFLAPHHCSKSAMYHDSGDGEKLMKDMLKDLEKHQVADGIIVASSEKIPGRNEAGDNPPHAKAKARYQECAEGGFLCTHEDGDPGQPLVFQAREGSFTALVAAASVEEGDRLAEAVNKARGSDTPPSEKIGYGT